MPLKKLQFNPGVNRETTSYGNEGGWYECNKIRFRSGQPEKLGGWISDSGVLSTVIAGVTTDVAVPPTGTLWGIARALWNWVTLSAYNLLAVGTNLKYYIQNGPGGAFYDVTPLRILPTLATNAFTTTAASTQVRVNYPSHGAQTGDFVTISGTTAAVNGISQATMNGEYQITYLDANSYYITVATAATSSGTPAVNATFAYQINTGNDIYTFGVGWGSGAWGGTVTGVAATTLGAVTQTTLNGTVTAAATSIVLTSAAGFTAPGTIVVDNELITFSGVSTNTLTGCVRGTGGTFAVAHSTGAIVQLVTTTITVASTTGFGTSGTFLIDSELISYTGTSPTTFTGCTRAASGTSPAVHLTGAIIQLSTLFTGWGLAAVSGVGVGLQLRLWSQSNFGENLVFCPRGSPMYYWDTNANPATFDRGVEIRRGTTVGGAPVDSSCPDVVNFVLVSDASRFVVAFGCNDPTGVYATTALDPMQIRWSDQESYYTWNPAVTNQAGDYRLSRGSSIVTAIQTRQEILVFTDSAVYAMQYLGPPYVWGFQILEDNISINGPNVVATASNVTFWMGMDKFFMYSGRVQTLPCTLREYVFTDINLSQAYQFHAGTNEGYSEVWWSYCSANSTEIDRYVVYDYLDQVWWYGDWANFEGDNQGRTAWLDSSLREAPMSMIYGVAGGTTNAQLVYQETGVDDATVNPPNPIVAYIQSSDFDIGDGHNYGFVWRLIPDLTFDGSFVNNPTADFTVRPRTFPGANYGTSAIPEVISAQNYQNQRTYTVQQFTEQVYVRIRGRQMAFKVGSSTLGVQWQLGVSRIDIRPDGRRS
jgi:hypothetical protein